MSTNRKASMAKRARELAQKDGVKDREARRAERKARHAARVASGVVGPEIDFSSPADGLGESGDRADAAAAADQPLPDSPGE